jgi:regulator of nucleoside diphosphate kinase
MTEYRSPDCGSRPLASGLPAIYLTRRDHSVLSHWLESYAVLRPSPGADLLRRELLRATLVDAPRWLDGIAAMHTQVVFHDDDTGRERTVTLVYPSERSATDDALSVLTSLGAALIGLAEGQSIAYHAPNGARRRVTVLEVRPGKIAANSNIDRPPAA